MKRVHHRPRGDGVPEAPPAETTRRMQAQKRRDTGIERSLRSALHCQGLRFRVHVQPIAALRREVDVVFSRARVAVFVDGCFWHGCPEHATWPKRNAEWWREKIEHNRARDLDTDERLEEEGWISLRVWEHEDPEEAATRIARIVRERLGIVAAKRQTMAVARTTKR